MAGYGRGGAAVLTTMISALALAAIIVGGSVFPLHGKRGAVGTVAFGVVAGGAALFFYSFIVGLILLLLRLCSRCTAVVVGRRYVRALSSTLTMIFYGAGGSWRH